MRGRTLEKFAGPLLGEHLLSEILANQKHVVTEFMGCRLEDLTFRELQLLVSYLLEDRRAD